MNAADRERAQLLLDEGMRRRIRELEQERARPGISEGLGILLVGVLLGALGASVWWVFGSWLWRLAFGAR